MIKMYVSLGEHKQENKCDEYWSCALMREIKGILGIVIG